MRFSGDSNFLFGIVPDELTYIYTIRGLEIRDWVSLRPRSSIALMSGFEMTVVDTDTGTSGKGHTHLHKTTALNSMHLFMCVSPRLYHLQGL